MSKESEIARVRTDRKIFGWLERTMLSYRVEANPLAAYRRRPVAPIALSFSGLSEADAAEHGAGQ